MALSTPKAVSVTKDGHDDGFEPEPGYVAQVEEGSTRLLVSVPNALLAGVHQDLVRALEPPLGVLYRQLVDRRRPRPEGAPSRDFMALDLRPDRVIGALDAAADLVYHDARCEVWVRGKRGEQVILDADGVIYVYPDDPSFRDVCHAHGLPEGPVKTLLDRDYVKHWYHAQNDESEGALVDALGLVEMATR